MDAIRGPAVGRAATADGVGRSTNTSSPVGGAEAGGQTDFSTLLGDAISGVASRLRQAESISTAGIKGTASMQDVVEKVMAAEQSLQASIAVRDKIVSAYLEISRMAI